MLAGLCYCATAVMLDGTYFAFRSHFTKYQKVIGIALTAYSKRGKEKSSNCVYQGGTPTADWLCPKCTM